MSLSPQDEQSVFEDAAFGPTDSSLFGGSSVDLGDKAAGKQPPFKAGPGPAGSWSL